MKILLTLIVTIVALTSCGGSWHYSPLDSYINAEGKAYTDSVKSVREAKVFIDSLNASHTVK